MKSQIRYFSFGLFISAIILSAIYFFFDKPSSAIENVEVNELIKHVENNGYRVISEEDFIAYSVFSEGEREKKSNKKEEEKESNNNDEKAEKNNSTKNDEDKTEKNNSTTEKPKKSKKPKTDKDENSKENKDDVKKYTFTTESGVVSQDIAEKLYKNGIIDDEAAFKNYLEDNDYAKYIQLGTFEVTSDMSFQDLAKVVTTYPGSN